MVYAFDDIKTYMKEHILKDKILSHLIDKGQSGDTIANISDNFNI